MPCKMRCFSLTCITMKTILVPVDFSDITGAVIEQAAVLAQAFPGNLYLIHVAPPDPDFVGYEAGPQSVRDQVAAKFCKEHQALQKMSEDLRVQGIPATALLVQGATAATILEEAARLNADVIVLGSHGHGGLYKALLGSVSEGLLRKTTRPLLIVPSRKEHA